MMALLPDSTETTRHKVRERRRRKRGWFHRLRRRLKWTTVLIVVVATVVVVVVGSLVLVTDATNKVQSALTSLQRVLLILNGRTGADLTLDDFDRLQASVRDLNGSLNAARGQLVFMRPLTGFNKNLSATFQAMDAAGDLSAAADTVLNGLRPTVFFMFYGEDDPNATAPLSSGERVVELLRIGRTQFATASHLLDSAQERIDNLELGDLSPDLVLYFNDLNQYADELTRANDILLQSPELLTTALGLSQTQAYLILSQNSDELRPSGGYIGTYGWMTLRNGRITDYNYSPTTATSPNPPPNTLADQIDIPDWWLHYSAPIYAAWDGSWSVDFGETAERAIWYYNNGNNPQAPVGGAIGIDIVGFEYILEALDSVVVPGYDEVITTENFRQVVYEIRESSAGDSPHKRFIARLYQQIFADWQNASTDPALSTEILGAVLRALREKHIMLYFADSDLNDAMDLLGWAGRLTPAATNDYLLVADANLGNKSNRSITRQITFDVDIQADGSLNDRVTVNYDYPARVAELDPAVDPRFHGPLDYDNLLQVFVPVGSRLVETDELPTAPTVVPLLSHTDFVSRLSVPYDTTQRVQLGYQTPSMVQIAGDYHFYRLHLQKQPGTLADRVSVQVSLPSNAQLLQVTPEVAAQFELERPILEFRLDLVTDQWVEIVYLR